MKIFISYGHDFTKEAKIIANSLVAIGHEVWIDYDKILPGDDWRDSITEGILGADAVLAMMSNYGLRDGGVCLDELAIAVSCNRRNIRPVVMERGAEALAPACIRGIQFFDMSEWRNIDKAHFDDWYKQKFDSLVELCLSRTSAYEQKLSSIKNKLHVSSEFSRELFELGKDYKKRNWLDDKISEWVNGNFSNICLLVGFPGFGKSCYCTNSYYYGDDVAGLIFCDPSDGKRQGVISAVKEISFGLAVRIPSFATRLDRILSDPDVNTDSSPEKLFELLIMEPLNLIGASEEKIVIMIDAVDILSENGENRLAKLFIDNSERFPSYIKFLLSCRSDLSVLGGASDIYRIVPDPSSKDIFCDIQEYVADNVYKVCGNESNNIGTAVAEKAQGSFLYASAVSDGLKSGKIAPSDALILPEKVSDVYYKWMSQIVSTDEFGDNYAEAISVLSALDNPPIELIKKVMGWRQSEVTSFLRKFSVLLLRNVDKFHKTCVSFYCTSFANWVKTEERSEGYCAPAEDGFKAVAGYLADAYDEEELTDYDYIVAIDVLRNSGKKKLLRRIATDDDFFTESFRVIRDLQRDTEFYREWNLVLDGLDYLITEFESNDDHARSIAYYRAKGEFICGDLVKSGKILDQNEKLLDGGKCNEEYFDYLYMSGTTADFKGERNRSVTKFSTLLDKAGGVNPDYEVRALEGLIWNGHFNNVDAGLMRLKRLEGISMSEELSTMKDLLSARMLLSAGEVKDALKLFGSVLEKDSEHLWSHDVVSRKNQMLVIEAVVAAYDAGRPDLSIEYGKKILTRLEGSGSLSECYCLSWLALSEQALGNTNNAYGYLNRAKDVLYMGEEDSSKWLKMHLKSIEANFLKRAKNYVESVALYREVEALSKECDDPWVQGDALFDIIAIGFISDTATDPQGKLFEALSALAESTALPHLVYKKEIASVLLRGGNLTQYVNIPSLASVDEKEIASLLYKKALETGDPSSELFKDLTERK